MYGYRGGVEEEWVLKCWIVLCVIGHTLQIQKLEKNYDVFFHLAWRGTTGSDWDDIEMQLNNVAYTVDAVNLAARLGCRTFVGIGSQAECGKVEEKICGSTTCNPENAYGAAKLAARHMSRVKAKKLGMRHIWVRLLTVYGPLDCNGFVAPTIRKIIDGIVPSFTKGEQLCDFLYYKDAGKALRLIGEKGIDGKIYVIGNGTERTLFSYIEEMNQVLAPNMEFRIGDLPYSSNQVMYLCADNTEVGKDVGWKPETRFKDGVKETKYYIERNMKKDERE